MEEILRGEPRGRALQDGRGSDGGVGEFKTLAAKRRMSLPTKVELESLTATELAAKCQSVGDDPSRYSAAVADEARQLKSEWDSLQTSRDPDYTKEKPIEAQRKLLKTRMADFLASYL
jgi:hypothetical protein